jgi:hypothetical protein
MVLVVVLLGFFCLVGLTARRYGVGVQWLLFAGIALMVILDFVTHALP